MNTHNIYKTYVIGTHLKMHQLVSAIQMSTHNIHIKAYVVGTHLKCSEEAKWSGSTLFGIQYVNLYQQSGSSNLIGWKFEKGVAS